jgi:hypothetical protein
MSAEDREFWLVRTIKVEQSYTTEKYPGHVFYHTVYKGLEPLKRLHLATMQDLQDRDNKIYLKWGTDWYRLERDPHVKDVVVKEENLDEGICSYCGRPSNSTDCQRSHP